MPKGVKDKNSNEYRRGFVGTVLHLCGFFRACLLATFIWIIVNNHQSISKSEGLENLKKAINEVIMNGGILLINRFFHLWVKIMLSKSTLIWFASDYTFLAVLHLMLCLSPIKHVFLRILVSFTTISISIYNV